MQLIKIFISSPSDVRPERQIAARVIEQLGRELANYCKIEPVLWERQPLKANHHFQNPVNIPAPHTTDIAIVILWLRLGVFLPAPTFLGAKTGRVVTGTEWEFEDAFNANQEQGAPELLVYRKTAASLVIVGDESEQRNIQKKLVDDFIARWFVNKDDGNFRAASHCFSGPTEFEEMLYTHLRALLLQRIGNPADLNSVHWHKGSPFRGLESFDTEHAQIFFGRRRIRNDIRDAIYQQIKLGRSILMVMGASGSGKSSLVKAGLIPDLMLPGMLPNVGLVRWVVMRPKSDPMTALHNALLASTALPELAQSLSQLINAAPPQLAVIVSDGLAAVSRAAQLAEPWVSRLILVVDQFEELFDATINSEVRDAFIASLAALALKGDVLIIATMRSDFYPLLEQMPALVSITAGPGRFLLLPPDDAEIGEIILGPAQEAGLVFETQPETQGALNEKLRQDAAAEPGILPLLEFTLYKAVFSPDGSKLAIVDFNYTVHLLNAKTMAELLVMKGSHAGYIRSIAFSGAGHRLITASEDQTARIWDTDNGAELQVLNGHFGVLVSAKLNSDGHVAATSSEDGTARLWNADSGEQLHILNGRDEIDMLAQIKPDDMQRITKFVYSVKFNQDGSRVLTIAADGIARLWNVASGLKLFELEGVGYDENAAQFSADGKRIFTTLINEVKIWNAENGAELQVLKGREYNFNLARFSGDGQRIVTASDDNTVRLWDADTGKVLLELTGHTAEVNAAEFTQNAQKLVTASRDGTIRLWDLANFQAKVQIDYARAAELEVLSPEQRDKLFLSQQDTAEMAGQNACDALAAEPFDTDNPNFRKIKYQEIEAKQAIPACRQAVAEDSHTIRYQFQLALALKQDNQYDEALQLADQACEKSYAAACRLAAQLVGAAQGTPANPSRALELFKRAATLGNLAAANELAQLFWDGLNLPDDHLTIPVDRPAALQLWDNAANKGIPQALAALAQRYELGEELPKDLEKALYYHALSAKQFEFYGLNDLAKFEASRRGSLARRMNPELVAGIWHKQVIPWQPTQ